MALQHAADAGDDVLVHALDFRWVEGACRLKDGRLERPARDVDAVQKQRMEMYIELEARPESLRGVDRAGVELRRARMGMRPVAGLQ